MMPVHQLQIRDRSGSMFTIVSNMGSTNSVSGMASRLRAGGLSGVLMPAGTRDLLSRNVQTVMGFTQPSIHCVRGFFSAGTLVQLNTHFYLAPKLGMSDSMPLLLQYDFMTCRETTIPIINSISLNNLRFKVLRHLLSTRLAPYVDWAAVPFL